jgi:NADH:ubiquinone oxidoreductase subunit 4 (subunit M)
MENNFWLYIILIPIGINIISTVLYEFVKPRFTRWKAQTSTAVAQARIDEINEQIGEVTKYKDDYQLLVKVGFREILRAFWSVFVTGVAMVFYFLVQFVTTSLSASNRIPPNVSESILSALPPMLIGLLWGHFAQSLKRILYYYRLFRDVVDYSAFIKRKTSEIGYLGQNIKNVARAKRSRKS